MASRYDAGAGPRAAAVLVLEGLQDEGDSMVDTPLEEARHQANQQRGSTATATATATAASAIDTGTGMGLYTDTYTTGRREEGEGARARQWGAEAGRRTGAGAVVRPSRVVVSVSPPPQPQPHTLSQPEARGGPPPASPGVDRLRAHSLDPQQQGGGSGFPFPAAGELFVPPIAQRHRPDGTGRPDTTLDAFWTAAVEPSVVACAAGEPRPQPPPLFVLYGEAGAGKTSALRWLEARLWEEAAALSPAPSGGRPVVPLRVSLRDVVSGLPADPRGDFVRAHLVRAGYSEAEAEALLAAHTVVVLLDDYDALLPAGYDERPAPGGVGEPQSPSVFSRSALLATAASGPVVLACPSRFAHSCGVAHAAAVHAELFLCGFGPDQVREYLAAAGLPGEAASAALFVNTPPLALALAAGLADTRPGVLLSSPPASRFALFAEYAARWLGREFDAIAGSPAPSSTAAPQDHPLHRLAATVALAVHAGGATRVAVSDLGLGADAIQLIEVLQRAAGSPSPDVAAFAVACPLRITPQGLAGLAHSAFVDFLVAQSLLSAAAAGSTRLSALLASAAQLSAHQAPGVVAFVRDAWPSRPLSAPLEQGLLDIVAASQNAGTPNPNPPAATTTSPSANAAALLNAVPVPLCGLAWRGAQLAGADLSNAVLAASDLAGADLSGARLGGAVLAGAGLAGANLAGAGLGAHALIPFAAPVASVALHGHLLGIAFEDSLNHDVTLWDWRDQLLVAELHGHTGTVTCTRFSPDGRILASGGYDDTCRLWDVAGQGPIGYPLRGHTLDLTCLAFSPDGKTLASGSSDRTCRLWNVATQDAVGHPLTGHARPLTAVAFSPDGQLVATTSADRTCRLWSVASREAVAVMEWGSPLTSVAFGPRGALLATGSSDSSCQLWDPAHGKAVGLLRGHAGPVNSLAIAPSGRWLVSGAADATCRLWCLARLQPLTAPIPSGVGEVLSLAVSAGGLHLALGGRTSGCRLIPLAPWCLPRVADRTTRLRLQGPLTGAAFSPDGALLATGCRGDGQRPAPAAQLWELPGSGSRPSPAGQALLDAVPTRRVALLDSGDIAPPGGSPGAPRAGPHRVFFAAPKPPAAAALWDVAVVVHGAASTGPSGEDDEAERAVAVSPDGQLLACAVPGACLVRKAAAAPDPPFPVAARLRAQAGDWFDAVALSSDGGLVATGGQDATCRVWDLGGGGAGAGASPVSQILRGHRDWVTAVAFSADGRLLASGSHDKTCRLWDVGRSTALGKPLRGHRDRVTCLAFRPDGAVLASGAADCTCRLWDVPAQRTLAVLRGHSGALVAVAFSPDGRRLATCDAHLVLIWELADGQCPTIAGALSAAEQSLAACDLLTAGCSGLSRANRLLLAELRDAQGQLAVLEPEPRRRNLAARLVVNSRVFWVCMALFFGGLLAFMVWLVLPSFRFVEE